MRQQCKKGQGNGRMPFVYVLKGMLKSRGAKIILIDALSLWALFRESFDTGHERKNGFRKAVLCSV